MPTLPDWSEEVLVLLLLLDVLLEPLDISELLELELELLPEELLPDELLELPEEELLELLPLELELPEALLPDELPLAEAPKVGRVPTVTLSMDRLTGVRPWLDTKVVTRVSIWALFRIAE